MTKLNLSLPGSRQHFELLDGLRGIAALAIVLFHFMEIIFADPTQNFIGHGFLAVDFFFCLSGFVIPYAYDPVSYTHLDVYKRQGQHGLPLLIQLCEQSFF